MARGELALDVGDDVHDVRVALGDHEIGEAHGVEFADAADVVAGEIDEHDVLGAFLGSARSSARAGRPPRASCRAGACRRWGGLRLALFAADVEFRRGADERHAAELEDEHVGRGIDEAQRAVEIDGRVSRRDFEALRRDDLEDVAGADVFLHGLGHFDVLVARHVDGGLERLDVVEDGEETAGDGADEAGFEFLDLGDGFVISAVGVGGIGDVRVGDDFDAAFEMVEDEERVGDEEVGVGDVEVVLFGALDRGLELRDGLEAEVADGAAGKEREAFIGDGDNSRP